MSTRAPLLVAIAMAFLWSTVSCVKFGPWGSSVEVGASREVVWPFVLETASDYGLDLEVSGDDPFAAVATVLEREIFFQVEPLGEGRSRLIVSCDCGWPVRKELIEAMRERLVAEGIEMDEVGYPAMRPQNDPEPVLTEIRRRHAERDR